jgi:hypothetical protein
VGKMYGGIARVSLTGGPTETSRSALCEHRQRLSVPRSRDVEEVPGGWLMVAMDTHLEFRREGDADVVVRIPTCGIPGRPMQASAMVPEQHVVLALGPGSHVTVLATPEAVRFNTMSGARVAWMSLATRARARALPPPT